MAEEKKYMGVETDLFEIIMESVQAFVSKCAYSADYLSKKGGEIWNEVVNPPENVKERILATGSLALHMSEMMSKDPNLVKEIAEHVIENLAQKKGRDLTEEEEEMYVKSSESKSDVMYG